MLSWLFFDVLLVVFAFVTTPFDPPKRRCLRAAGTSSSTFSVSCCGHAYNVRMSWGCWIRCISALGHRTLLLGIFAVALVVFAFVTNPFEPPKRRCLCAVGTSSSSFPVSCCSFAVNFRKSLDCCSAITLRSMSNACLVVSTSHWSSSPSLLPPLNLRSEDACVLLELPRQRFLCLVVDVRSTYGCPGSDGFASLLLQGLEDACLVVSTSHWSSSPSLLPPLNLRSEDACVLLELPRQRFLCFVVAVL